MEPRIVRSADEVQRAHDLLASIVLGEAPNPFAECQRASVRASADVLCWLLGHQHNAAFGEFLSDTELAMRQLGWELTERT